MVSKVKAPAPCLGRAFFCPDHCAQGREKLRPALASLAWPCYFFLNFTKVFMCPQNAFVKILSVNGGQLPTNSQFAPDLHRKIFFCTFADVEKRLLLSTPKPEGRGQSLTHSEFSIMAKSKSGGTRSYIRGRVGADVYSIGKDGAGKKQQVVRSLAETVANPQTAAQMRGRMIMSTIMQAVSAMSALIDHSFDGYPAGQPSISEFIRRNYALIKADVAAHPSSNNEFGLNKYQEKGAKHGAYVVSNGKALLPSGVVNSASALAITVAGSSMTQADLIESLGLSADDFITLLGITDAGELAYCRMHVRTDIAGSTAISGTDITDFFDIEGNDIPSFAVAGQVISIALTAGQANSALIVSRKSDSGYQHNKAVLIIPSAPQWTADVALATYPEGSQRFLNGGDFSGGGISPEPTPTPTPGEEYALTITHTGLKQVSLKVGDTTINSGDNVAAGSTVTVVFPTLTSSTEKFTLTLNGQAVPVTGDYQSYAASFVMPSQASTFNSAYEDEDAP